MEEAKLQGPGRHKPKHSCVHGIRTWICSQIPDYLAVSAAPTGSFAFTRGRLTSSAHPAQIHGRLGDVFIQHCSGATEWQIRLLMGFSLKGLRRFVAIPIFQIPSTQWCLPALVHLLACSHSYWKPGHSNLILKTWCRKLWKQNWPEQLK